MKILLVGYETDILLCEKSMTEVEKQVFVLSDTRGIEELQAVQWTEYDIVILAVEDKNICDGICSILESFGLANEKILNFYQLYHATMPGMIVERRMQYPECDQYKGMILGISHAEVGIIPRYFNLPFCNLAVSSQDIYYNMKTLEYCIKEFPEKVRNLEYLIVDMFDYTYFNFDISLSRMAHSYYMWGGFDEDAHNFNDNKHYDYSFEELKRYFWYKKYKGIDDHKIDVWDTYFADAHKINLYREYAGYPDISNRLKVVSDKQISEFKVETSIVKNQFDKTIEENINSFYELLRLIYKWNPDIKVYIVILPVYDEIRLKCEAAYRPWKEFFYSVIHEANQKFPFVFLDLKEHEISTCRNCFYDATHLNYYGAARFSSWLSEYINSSVVRKGE